MAVPCASICRATPTFAGTNSFLDVRARSSATTGSISSPFCFRNGNARFQTAPRSALPKRFFGVVISRFGSNKCEVGFVKLGRFEGTKRWGGLASVRADATAVAESEGAQKSSEELIDSLLSLVDGSDRGALFNKEKHANVDDIVRQLEEYSVPEPLQSPLLFGDWDVAYSSNPTSPGGSYRSWIGRLVFKTNEMIQTLVAADVVINIVRFALFGFIPGEVILQGKLKALDTKMIQVDFGPPSIQIGPLKFNYGKVSSVKICVTYLDDTIRLGRGSRGTVFVFTRR